MDKVFREKVAGWPWLESSRSLKRFVGNPFAQAYELMRRLPEFKSELFFYNNKGVSWDGLGAPQRHLFSMTYKKLIERFGLRSSVTVTPAMITFDCSLSDNCLLEAVKAETEHPTPLAVVNSESKVALPRFNKKKGGGRLYVPRPKGKIWQVGRDPRIVHLKVPKHTWSGEFRSLSMDEIRAYFRSVIKDNPPGDLAEYRAMRTSKKAVRSPLPRTILLGIMALDCPEESCMKRLSDWLARKSSRKNGATIFSRSSQKNHKDLHNAKVSISRWIRDVCPVKVASQNSRFSF